MKKILYSIMACALALATTSCTEDFKDWANPQSYAQGSDAPKIEGTVKALVTDLDYATANDQTNLIELTGVALPEGADLKFTNLTLTDEATGMNVNVPFSYNGNVLVVNKDDLNQAVYDCFHSMSDAPRTLTMQVKGNVMQDGTAIVAQMVSNLVQFNYTAKALPAESKEKSFYLIGTNNGWALDATAPFEDLGDGKYSYIIEVADNHWFKIAPQSAVDEQSWDHVIGNPEDGSTAVSGFLTVGGSSGAMVIEKAGMYEITVDVVNWTYTVSSYSEILYYAGDANGWGHDPMVKWNGSFVGWYYIDAVDNSNTWGFKFDPSPDWSKPQYGAGATEGTIQKDGGNIVPAGNKAGFYQITVDTKALTVSLMEVTSISIIGTVNGNWDTDTDLTWDPELKAWTCTADLAAGEFKLRANHDWSLSWGGDVNAMTADNGANLTLDEAANYTLVFTPRCNGYGTLQVINNDNVLYYAGDANGWGHDPMAKVGGEYVGYYYIDAVDNSSTWGFKFDPSPDWSKPQYGAGEGAYALAKDGGNITLPENKSGFYQINVNLLGLTYSVSEITSISIIGSANGNWDTDTDLTYDHAAQAWVVETTLTDGEFKLRANHDWTLSWGGELSAMTSQNGANIPVSAGKYKFQFKPKCDGMGTLELIPAN